MAYFEKRVAEEAFNKAVMERHPLMNSAAMNAAMSNTSVLTAGGIGSQAAWLGGSPGMVESKRPEAYPYHPNTRNFTVEKVDNGFILRSGKYAKICKDMEELSAQFVATMVEQYLDK